MTKRELIQFVRVMTDDAIGPEFLVSDATLSGFIDESEREAACRAKYFRQTKKLPVSASKAAYTVDPLFIFIDRAKVENQSSILEKTSRDQLDFVADGWEEKTGIPTHYLIDGKQIVFYPKPDADYTVLLNGSRYPCEEMETPEPYHNDLAYWCLYRIYSIPDIDLYDLAKAENNLAKFRLAFGHKSEALFDTNWRNKSQNSGFFNPF